MATVEQVRTLAMSLPRTTEGIVRDSVRWRVGRLVYAALWPDETVLEFAFPRDERAALVAAEPDLFRLPRPSDLRFNWVGVALAPLDSERMTELVIDAWRMCVPKKVSALVP